ncbi:hypothetical protein SISNIDRAFT_491624 [Sistotremastrum niveocremeum HHB9708]|uniref:Uncharacterized protein n=1 Tax=Sistotremastrum niveocremeum HHB9708 TaxID=1314777 RepID=A0A164ML76_9AGAM|nr:hypothetical protein SISNIDRAFT_491624 [Sistotremastrum niveocremeum HHB9708]
MCYVTSRSSAYASSRTHSGTSIILQLCQSFVISNTRPPSFPPSPDHSIEFPFPFDRRPITSIKIVLCPPIASDLPVMVVDRRSSGFLIRTAPILDPLVQDFPLLAKLAKRLHNFSPYPTSIHLRSCLISMPSLADPSPSQTILSDLFHSRCLSIPSSYKGVASSLPTLHLSPISHHLFSFPWGVIFERRYNAASEETRPPPFLTTSSYTF